MPAFANTSTLGAIIRQPMRSTYLLILFSFYLVKASVGQEFSKSDIVNFKIKSITTIDGQGYIKGIKFYNDKGDVIKEGSLDHENQLQIDREFFYNDSSKLIEERTFTSSGEINSTSKYYNNDKSQVIKKEYISDDQVYATRTFEYNENGNLTRETQTSKTMGNTLSEYKYDTSNNLLIQEERSHDSRGKEERINYKYSDKGQLIEKKTKVYFFNTTITTTYDYNDTGTLKKVYEKSSNGVSSTTLYEYNDQGLLAVDTWESSISKKPQKTRYQIKFE
ncbi:hypothetical protein ACX0G7_26005 [Flavitalea antarctica]